MIHRFSMVTLGLLASFLTACSHEAEGGPEGAFGAEPVPAETTRALQSEVSETESSLKDVREAVEQMKNAPEPDRDAALDRVLKKLERIEQQLEKVDSELRQIEERGK